MTNIFSLFKYVIKQQVTDLLDNGILSGDLDLSKITVEPPRDSAHGDLATNVAMILAKDARLKPREIALSIAEKLERHYLVKDVVVAGPGFINIHLNVGIWYDELRKIIKQGLSYGDSNIGLDTRINVEFISANPTGPLHLGHVRGAVFGDSLSTLLEKVGHSITREYYINDAGAQIEVLARSAFVRYLEALGDNTEKILDGMYPGTYLEPVGEELARGYNDKWKHKSETEWLPFFKKFCVDKMMDQIKDDLSSLGVKQDVFFSESNLFEDGSIDKVLEELDKKGLIYDGILSPPKGKLPEDWEPRKQTLFKSSEFGDDVDRPLKKSDGSWTYFASDIAYHFNKYQRGFDALIDVWGADHGGYVKRMGAAVKAISNEKLGLDVHLCQMVRLTRGGHPVKMSKRSGDFITLREVLDEVGRDTLRFIMLTRKNDAPLDFDFEKVTEENKDNAVFYVQYAHARIQSVIKRATVEMKDLDVSDYSLLAAKLENLCDDKEISLLKLLGSWPRVVETAAQAREPHRIAFYLHDLAAEFHALWNHGNINPNLRFIVKDSPAITLARIALLKGIAIVIASGLSIMGVQPSMEMR